VIFPKNKRLFLNSNFVFVAEICTISLVKVAPRIEASFPELNGSPLTIITQTSKSIKAF
jgi:hypothetical protein